MYLLLQKRTSKILSLYTLNLDIKLNFLKLKKFSFSNLDIRVIVNINSL